MQSESVGKPLADLNLYAYTDSVGKPVDDGLNLFKYSANDPVNFIDPFGLMSKAGKGVGEVFIGSFQVLEGSLRVFTPLVIMVGLATEGTPVVGVVAKTALTPTMYYGYIDARDGVERIGNGINMIIDGLNENRPVGGGGSCPIKRPGAFPTMQP